MRKLPALTALSLATVLTLTACTDASQSGGGSGSTASGGATTSAAKSFDTSTIKKDDAVAAALPADIASAGKLTVASNTVYAPAEYIDKDGKTPIGYDMDIIKAVGATMGVKVEIQSAEFASIIPALGSKFDAGISSFTITPERMAEANMVSYFSAGEAFSVQKGNPKKVDSADLCGLTMAVQTGTVEDDGAEVLTKECTDAGKEPIEILKYADQADATTNLVGGKADVMYADSPIVQYAIEQTGGQIEQLGQTFNSAPQGVVTAKDDTELAQAIQLGLQKLMDDGTLDKILDSWGNDGGLDKSEVNPTVE